MRKRRRQLEILLDRWACNVSDRAFLRGMAYKSKDSADHFNELADAANQRADALYKNIRRFLKKGCLREAEECAHIADERDALQVENDKLRAELSDEGAEERRCDTCRHLRLDHRSGGSYMCKLLQLPIFGDKVANSFWCARWESREEVERLQAEISGEGIEKRRCDTCRHFHAGTYTCGGRWPALRCVMEGFSNWEARDE